MTDPAKMTREELLAALGYEHNYARLIHAEPGRAEFTFDDDLGRWPWLCLSPLHPIVLDKVQYFAGLTSSLASEVVEAGTRTALTKITWTTTPRPGGTRHATRGVMEGWSDGGIMGYELNLFDEDGHHNAKVRGSGATFADRDFGSWRAQAKSKAAERVGNAPAPVPSDPVAAGLGSNGHCFLSEPDPDTHAMRGLVGAVSGFPPAHPFHTGTGDHVNAAHLFDCALQAAHLVGTSPGTRLECRAGEAEFLRFVELDVPFEVRPEQLRPLHSGGRITLAFSQAERDAARVTLELVLAS